MAVLKKIVVDPPLDMSKLIEGVESKPIVPIEEKPLVVAKSNVPMQAGRYDVPVEERLKEDLKISYKAKGILRPGYI